MKILHGQMDEVQIEKTAQRCREKGILLPTFTQMKDPEQIPGAIKDELKQIGLWDLHPKNLFRITWKNEQVRSGGLFGGVNHMMFPSEITGVKANIVALVGKWFPTGAHKVGATYGCLAPAMVTGKFEPQSQKAVWPSTGNYCRGGAYVSNLLACESIAILPEEMSRERFEWLAGVAGEVIATPGCESNVKEIFDKCWELKAERDDIVIFNQFDEFGNHLWHYEVTGHAMEEVLHTLMGKDDRLAGVVLTSGSAGTLGSGDYLKEKYPGSKIAVAEALQCPTILYNGFGGHRIEGIGDKHIPWIHNVRNSDVAIAVDDNYSNRLQRLFNEPVGRKYLEKQKFDPELIADLDLLGLSGIANLVASIKFARYFELDENDYVMTVLTDSMELYGSRLKELDEEFGPYTEENAARDFEFLNTITIDNMAELDYYGRKRVHNLKYYTWIEQQARETEELNSQWYDKEYWKNIHEEVKIIDEKIELFNDRVRMK